jgi:hypothetical protein
LADKSLTFPRHPCDKPICLVSGIEVYMIDFDLLVRVLRRTREELVDQIDAVDRAIGILSQPGTPDQTRVQDFRKAEPVQAEHDTVSVQPVPEKRKGRRPGFRLSEGHKQALLAGRRKKLEAMRTTELEPVEAQPAHAIAAWKANVPPRLVKERKELVVEPLEEAAIS